jgi:hypothetical protein
MRAMYLYEAPLHLLRALTVPPTPDNTELARPHWNNGFEPRGGAVTFMPPPLFLFVNGEPRMKDAGEHGPPPRPGSSGCAAR